MYAVIRTGGKQYRVQPGDLMVVEKLDGDVGAELSFDQVLMVGGDAGEIAVGAPLVAGGIVRATLIETRKGEKVKIFKKIRRQGYRRTRGHRQFETVLRVTGLEGGGLSANWDGTVDLTPRLELNARARGLAPRVASDAPGAKPARRAPGADAAEAAKAAKVSAPSEADAALLADVVEPAAPAKAPSKAEAAAKPAAKAKPKAEAADKPVAKKPAAKKPAPKA